MKSALTHGSGPGSAIALSPTSIRVRDAIIEKFIDKSLDELSFLLLLWIPKKMKANASAYWPHEFISCGLESAKSSNSTKTRLMNRVEAVSPHELVNSLDDEEPDKPHIDEGDEEDMGQ